MTYLVIDCEATTKNTGNPFTESNKLVAVGCKTPTGYTEYKIEYGDEAYGHNLLCIQALIDQAIVVVGFNIKYDLHWLRKYGLKFQHKQIWDVQYAYFVQHYQDVPYPSLNNVYKDYYGKEGKLDVVKTEYWDNGIDTDKVPWEVLSEYLKQDVDITEECYLKQLTDIEPKQQKLIKLAGLDLLTLQEMEYNGLLYDSGASNAKSSELDLEVSSIDKKLAELVPNVFVNWASNDHRSCVLYGGVITEDVRVPFVKKDGSVSENRNSVKQVHHKFQRIVEPLKGSELKKEGYWSTDTGTFSKLKATGKAKQIIELLLRRSEIEKVNGTYYKGIPKLMEKMEWGDKVHGNLNQTVAVTGRLSSSKPNMQNNPHEVDKYFRSRYD